LREVITLATHKLEGIQNSHIGSTKETPLIDRAREMSLLKEAADKAISDQGEIFFLYGEAGIGKTRLTKELKEYAHSRGMKILYGRCPALFKMNDVSPYSPWKEIIKDYLQVCTPEQLQRTVGYYPGEIYKIVPEIKQKLITFSESPPLSSEMERDRLFEAVSQFVTNISKITPLVVILDDLQWADSSSLLLLHYLARGIFRENLLLLGVYRDTEVEENHPLYPIMTELNRARLLQSTQLKRMSPNEITEMIRQILGQTDTPREFCELVYEKTNGNPFFVEEVIASLKEEGTIVPDGNKYKIREVTAIEFPKTVKDVLKARLGRLDEECQNVLTLASCIGNDFTSEALREVTGFEEGKLLETLEKILKTGLLKCRAAHGEDTCSFADVLIRDLLFDEVSPLRRKGLHKVVGYALEKVYAKNIDEHFGELASHFLESGDKDKALDYFLRAGEKAEKVYANKEAASYYQSALKLLEEEKDDLQKRAYVQEVLGDIKKLTCDFDISLAHWEEASRLWEQLGKKENAARVFRKTAYVIWAKTGDSKKAEGYYDRALKILEGQPESVELADLYVSIGEMHWHFLEIPKATALVEQALKIAEKLEAYEIIAHSYMIMAIIFAPSNRKKASEYSEEALKIALNHGYVKEAVQAYTNLANAAFGSLSAERRRQFATEGYELAKRIGAISNQAFISSILAGMYFGEGEIDKALLLNEESITLNRKAGNLHQLPLSLTPLGAKYLVLGDWEKSEKCLKEALMIAQKTNDVPAIGHAFWNMGQLLVEQGKFAEAREFALKLYNQFEKTGTSLWQAYAAGLIGYISIKMGDLETAENYVNRMEQIPQELKTQVYHLILARRAMLFRAQKKLNESLEYFEKSLKERYREGDFWDTYSYSKRFLLEYAQVYLERNQEGDKKKALDLLNQALETFQKLHANKDIEEVKAQITYLQTRRIISLEPLRPIVTGYATLDKLLNGGIPAGFAAALTSPSCDERDTLIRSFLETGAKTSDVTFYLTIEPSSTQYLAETFQSNFYLLVCNPQAETIVKSAPNIFQIKGIESLTGISIALTSAIRKLDPSSKTPRRICIDLISDVLLQHRSAQTRKWLTEILTHLRSMKFTTLAVINPQMHPQEELYAILSLFDGEISIREAETDKGLNRFLRVKRMSNQKYLKDEIILRQE
jgi:tetratricopeptide (TPR) repeat protein/KaiC/GvpD/RAD55 family RecA-like ATPase